MPRSAWSTDAPGKLGKIARAGDAHLDFAARTAVACELDRSPELDAAFRRVRERLADTDLRLVLVGEFSSGKSTFINALLDEPPLFPEKWLKTSALATTGAETEVRHGALKLEARLHGEQGMIEFMGAGSRLARTIAEHCGGGPGPGDVTAMLRVLTTDARLAGVVDAVRLWHPDPLLGPHVVLVDTPGIDPDDRYAHHAAITRRAVERADAALVLIPADQPLSATLTAFLEETLAPYMSRCVFLVSRMARIDADERDDVVEWVRAEIRARFGLAEPLVLGAALNIAEAYARDPARVDASDMEWVASFARLEDTLQQRLATERAAVVSESVLRVVEQLVAALHEQLAARRANVQQDRRALADARIRGVDDLAAELKAECHQRLHAATRGAQSAGRTAIERQQRALDAAIRAKLATAVDKSQLKYMAGNQLGPIARKSAKQTSAALKRTTTAVTSSAQDIASDIDARFAEEYRRLQPVATPVARMPRHVDPIDVSDRVAASLDTYQLKWLVRVHDTRVAYDFEDEATLAMSAVKHWFKSLHDVRAELLGAILGPLGRAFEHMAGEFEASLEAWRQRERRATTADIDKRVEAYRAVVTALSADQAREQTRLDSAARRTEAAISDAEQRLAQLRAGLGRTEARAGVAS